jgi:hypothetical protein
LIGLKNGGNPGREHLPLFSFCERWEGAPRRNCFREALGMVVGMMRRTEAAEICRSLPELDRAPELEICASR